jgi:hypothetical protein
MDAIREKRVITNNNDEYEFVREQQLFLFQTDTLIAAHSAACLFFISIESH